MNETFGDISKALISEAAKTGNNISEIFAAESDNITMLFGQMVEIKEINGYINIYFKNESLEKLTTNIIQKLPEHNQIHRDFLLYYINNRCEYLLESKGKGEKDDILRKQIVVYYYKYFYERDIFTGKQREIAKNVREKAKKELAEIFYQRDREKTKEKTDYLAVTAFYKILNSEE